MIKYKEMCRLLLFRTGFEPLGHITWKPVRFNERNVIKQKRQLNSSFVQ